MSKDRGDVVAPVSYITISEAASELRVSEKTIRRRIKERVLVATRSGAGGVYRISRAELEAFIERVW